jgi:hypothetical protein
VLAVAVAAAGGGAVVPGVVSGSALAASDPGSYHVFSVSLTGNLYQDTWSGSWGGWQDLGNDGVALTGSPGIVYNPSDGTYHAYAIGTNGNVYQDLYTPASDGEPGRTWAADCRAESTPPTSHRPPHPTARRTTAAVRRHSPTRSSVLPESMPPSLPPTSTPLRSGSRPKVAAIPILTMSASVHRFSLLARTTAMPAARRPRGVLDGRSGRRSRGSRSGIRRRGQDERRAGNADRCSRRWRRQGA